MKTVSIYNRVSKVSSAAEAGHPYPIPTDFIYRFPDILAGQSLRLLVDRIVEAHRNGRPVIFTMGAHAIKVGLTPVLVELIRRGVLTGIATNGASIVHDLELSVFGCTSEDVIPSLKAGTFGVSEETHRIFEECLRARPGQGLGHAVGYSLYHNHGCRDGLFAAAYHEAIPITVHVSLGADVLHMNPVLDWREIAEQSQVDFRKFTNEMRSFAAGGVLVNWGSAVMMPEVILKSIGYLRNCGVDFEQITMANFDMIAQYRPQTRIVDVANELGGLGLNFSGHHEIMLPLVAGLVLGRLEE